MAEDVRVDLYLNFLMVDLHFRSRKPEVDICFACFSSTVLGRS
jgi:hypothetical protein